MKYQSHPVLLLILLLICAAVSTAQNNTAVSASVSSTSARRSAVETEFPTKEITEWVGDRFVFLGREPELRKYDYYSIYPANRSFGSLPYEKYVGKVVSVTSVTRGSVVGSYSIEMQVEGTGERLRANASMGSVDSLGSMADIERARALYVDKTLWREKGTLRLFDERSGKTSFISVGPSDPLKVLAVTAGWHNGSPVRIFVRTTSGTEAFVDVNFSGTNISDILRRHNRFDDEFQLVAPPRDSVFEAARSYQPSAEVLASAASGKDVLGWQQGWWGMTADEMVATFGSQLQKLPKRDLYSGMYAEYVIPNYKVDDDRYTVIFQMDNRTLRLAQVLIQSDEYSKDRPNLRPFNALEALLSQKYGPMRYHKDENEGFESHERLWAFKTTTIELSYLFMNGISSQLTIRYYPTSSSGANKL